MQTTIDKLGRIVVPKEMREHLGLMAGTTIEVVEKDHQIVITPLASEPFIRSRGGVLVYTGTAVGDLNDVVARHRAERAASQGF